MVGSEEISPWDRLVHPLARFLDYAFGCRHTHLSRVFTIHGRSYKVCCDCGKDFDYSLRTMAIVRHKILRPRLRLLRRQHT